MAEVLHSTSVTTASPTTAPPSAKVFPTTAQLISDALPASLNLDDPFPPLPTAASTGTKPDGTPMEPLEAATNLKYHTEVQLNQLNTQLELATGWVKVKEIEKMTAELKLEKLKKDTAASGKSTVQQEEEAAQGRLNLKAKEVAIARLKEFKLRTELRIVTLKEQHKKAELELENIKIVKRTEEMTSEISDIKRYISVVKGENGEMAKLGGLQNPSRTTFFYSDCKVGGLGRWFCETLGERDGWEKYPAQKWFVSQAGCQIYCPVGKVTVDYSDQPDFCLNTSSLSGSDWLEDKAKLASFTRHMMTPTYDIVDQKWIGDPPSMDLCPGDPALVWFVKESDKNYATGIHLAGTATEAMEIAKPNTSYVVQPHLANPMLFFGDDNIPYKFNLRVYIAAHSPTDDPTVHWYLHKGGYIAKAKQPYCPISTDRDVAISRDRAMPFMDWPGFEKAWPAVEVTVTELLKLAHPKFSAPVAKSSFELFGVDIMLDNDWNPFLLEVNRSPRVLDMDRPMLRALLTICVPKYAPPKGDEFKRWSEVGPFPSPPRPDASDVQQRDASNKSEDSEAHTPTDPDNLIKLAESMPRDDPPPPDSSTKDPPLDPSTSTTSPDSALHSTPTPPPAADQ